MYYRMVSTYLVHQGFCATAEAFISQTDQSFEEEIASIKNRQSKFILFRSTYIIQVLIYESFL